MTIKFIRGDMFTSTTEALVNTVNCVGVMGKGVALEFKRRWPENYKAYKKACDSKALRPGSSLIFDRGALFISDSPRYIINFPTKDHWRSKSKLEYISTGLDSLVADVQRLGIASVAMPPLGCGNGGLDWGVVKPLIQEKMSVLSDVEILVFAPVNEHDLPEHVNVPDNMTLARAMYIKAIASVEPRLGGAVDRLSLQKIAYFIQAFGVPLNLEFTGRLYGPYSHVLKKSMRKLEQWKFVAGYLQGDRYVHVTSAGYAAADEYLQQAGVSDEVVDRLINLIDGYGTPYGLELLARVHYESRSETYVNEFRVSSLTATARRQNKFSSAEIDFAKARLVADGLIAE